MYDLFEDCVSAERMETYLKASGFDQERAISLYFWNMRMSASFYPLLSSIEVCLRNLIVRQMVAAYGEHWWRDTAFHAIIGSRGKGILLRAQNDISRRGKSPTSGRMTAELSFGFWSNMLLEKYRTPLWSNFSKCFPSAPISVTQTIMYQRTRQTKNLRNRIFHYEPIIRRNHTQDYADAVELLGWLNEAKQIWLKPQLEIMKALRQRP